MDAQSAINKISELEDRVKELIEQRNNYEAALVNYQEFVRKIPRELGYQDGLECTPEEWIEWAKAELGYYGSHG